MKCVKCVEGKYIISIPYAEAALQRCSHENMPPPPQKKKCSKSTGEHSHRSVTSTKLPCSFIEVTLQHKRFPTNAPHKSSKTPSHKSTPKGLHSHFQKYKLIWKYHYRNNSLITNKRNQKLINILENQKIYGGSIFWFSNVLTSFWLYLFITKLIWNNSEISKIPSLVFCVK